MLNPVELTVPVWLWWGTARGRGRLQITDAGVIRAMPGKLGRMVLPPAVEHSGSEVTVFDGIVRVGVLIRPEDGKPWIAISSLRRRVVLAALRRSGHDLHVCRSLDAGLRKLRLARA